MTMPSHMTAQLAAERHRSRIDSAEAYRLGASVRRANAVRIRPIRPADDVLLTDTFARLSLHSRRMRFLAPKQRLSQKELRYLTDVDHHDHEALVALSRKDGSGVGVARYIRYRDDPQVADVAVTVVDEWQSRGVGTRMAMRLITRARWAGVRRLNALVLAENTRALRLLERVPGTVTLLSEECDELTFELELPPVSFGPRLAGSVHRHVMGVG